MEAAVAREPKNEKINPYTRVEGPPFTKPPWKVLHTTLEQTRLDFGHSTYTAKASHDTRTVVEKLSIEVKPKFFYTYVLAQSIIARGRYLR
jgi:hypothetical protein